MSQKTKIPYCDHTFNCWWGCTKVSDGCKLCYAETLAKRTGFDIWGNDKPRRLFGEKHWQEPLTWNKQAAAKGIKETVFCGSMCDVFEPRGDLDKERWRLWKLIEDTPNLIWLLLTKRPEYLHTQVPQSWLTDKLPENVWLGVTVESDKYLDRVEFLLGMNAKIFVSCEPLLSNIQFEELLWSIRWMIVGGESGAGARPMDIEWARDLRHQCGFFRIPYFFKQLGGFPDKQDRIEEWPVDLQVQQFPDWDWKPEEEK